MVRLEWTDKGNISIHAPTRGATMQGFLMIWILLFQSTLLQEERLHEAFAGEIDVHISIHAPTRGATNFHQKQNR